MQVTEYFSDLWYVHTNNGAQFDTMWTKRSEARDRKKNLRANGETAVVSRVALSYGQLTRDTHS